MPTGKGLAMLAVLTILLCFAGRASAVDVKPVQEKTLGHGSVQVYELGTLKLHAWQTGDAMHDACFVLETPTNLVAVESPAFNNDIVLWKEYTANLGKPLTDVFLSAHPVGGKWYGDAESHAAKGAAKAITAGATKALAESLGRTFGAEFNTDIAGIDAVLAPGANTIGGIDVEIMEAGDGYDIAVPSAGIIYTHMLGADTHSILTGQEHINAFLASLENMKAKGYKLILSGHHTPETPADVNAKIAYVRNIRALAQQSTGKDDFIARVKKAYPGYAGLNYLDMTAGYLFAE